MTVGTPGMACWTTRFPQRHITQKVKPDLVVYMTARRSPEIPGAVWKTPDPFTPVLTPLAGASDVATTVAERRTPRRKSFARSTSLNPGPWSTTETDEVRSSSDCFTERRISVPGWENFDAFERRLSRIVPTKRASPHAGTPRTVPSRTSRCPFARSIGSARAAAA